MDPKKMLSKEMAAKLGGNISEQTVSETVDKFFRHGNAFLLLEVMNLKNEIKTLREELEQRKNSKAQTLRDLLVQ
ncbi:MAG: hypothetical protein WC325_06555 [Candidatus Bathyarchaeia archaeon]|jgi:hypothetical protein